MNIRIPNYVAVAITFLLLVGFGLAFAYGVAAQRLKLFPYKYIDEVIVGIQAVATQANVATEWYYRTPERLTARPLSPDHPEPDALNLISSIVQDATLSIRIFDMQGETLHTWDVDVFDVWDNFDHLPERARPKSRPGTHVHGILLMENGDIVFNHNDVGTTRLTPCGDVVWQIRHPTHHSIHRAASGNLWISGRHEYDDTRPEFPLHAPVVWDPAVLEVNPDTGEILREISIMDLLDNNGLRALVSMRNANGNNSIRGDNLHLNDVETFDRKDETGLFEFGDVVVSLRNIHTIVVFDPDTLKVKYHRVGGFIRQHDPDFVDANTLLIYDNNFIRRGEGTASRILKLDARTDALTAVYPQPGGEGFYSRIMGKQQTLPGGRMLIAESTGGRAFEVDADGNVIWEFVNRVNDTETGIIEQAERLSPATRSLFENLNCKGG